MSRKIYRIQITGGYGLGDALLITPSFRAIKQQDPQAKIIVVAPKRLRELFKYNPHIDRLPSTYLAYVYFGLTLINRLKVHRLRYGFLRPSLFYKKGAAKILAEMLDVELSDANIEVFLTAAEEEKARNVLSRYNNPIIINPSTIFSKNKQWLPERWEELVQSLPNYTFIQLGLKGEEPLVKGAIDMRGEFGIRESIALLKQSLCYVGVDSFLAHVTNAVKTPGVVLFGPSSPVIWGHPENVNIYKKVQCSPCIDILHKDECPYSRECMTGITVDEVREAVTEQVKKRLLPRQAAV
jgi:ADP-heptose:LPS heptosyltransferase